MITSHSVTSIYGLAKLAEVNSVVVLPRADTPLAVLNSAIGDFDTSPEKVGGDLEVASNRKDVLGDKDHSIAIDEMVNIAAEAVQKQVKLARELVRPVATEAFEKVSAFLDEVPSQTLRHSIAEVNLPPIFLEAGIQDMVERYKNQPQMDLPSEGSMFPEMSSEDIIERCKTGMSRVDDALVSLINDSDDIVTRVYDDYFRNKGSYFDKPGSYTAETLVAFILARNLNMNVPDGVNAELEVYRLVTSNFIAEFGRRVYQILRRRDRIIRQKELIEFMPHESDVGSEIRVNGEVYRNYLKEGGTPEAIIGACLRGIDRPLYADLLEDAYGGAKAVVTNERLIQNRVVVEYEANVTMAILDVLGTIIKAGNFPEGVDVPVIKDVKEWLKKNPFRKKFDLDNYVLRVVCGALFPRYNSYPVLSGIMEYMSNDESLTAREAATLVVIDLVGEWLGSQLETEAL